MAKSKSMVRQAEVPQKRKIAIVSFRTISHYDDYDYTVQRIMENVTDFAEVDEETYQKLKQASYRDVVKEGRAWEVVEVQTDLANWIPKTVADYEIVIEAENKKREAEAQAAAEKTAARKLAKTKKTQAEKLAMLQTLQAELTEAGVIPAK